MWLKRSLSMLGSKSGRMKQVIIFFYYFILLFYFIKSKLLSFKKSTFICSPQLAVDHIGKKKKSNPQDQSCTAHILQTW